MNEWSFVCDDIGKYIESGTTFFPTLNLAALGQTWKMYNQKILRIKLFLK